MSDYIDLSALGQVLAASLLLGAGLVAVFAVGLVGLSMHEGTMASGEHSDVTHQGSPAGLAVAAICFTIVVGGVGLGLWTILAK